MTLLEVRDLTRIFGSGSQAVAAVKEACFDVQPAVHR